MDACHPFEYIAFYTRYVAVGISYMPQALFVCGREEASSLYCAFVSLMDAIRQVQSVFRYLILKLTIILTNISQMNPVANIYTSTHTSGPPASISGSASAISTFTST